jgi:hypothetical protein
MALFRNVLKKGDTWSELYVDICSDTCDDCANEIMAVSVIPPQLAYVHSCDFLQCFMLVIVKQITEEGKSRETESADDLWCNNNRVRCSPRNIGCL